MTRASRTHLAPFCLFLGMVFGFVGLPAVCAGDETFDTQIYDDPFIPLRQVEIAFHKGLIPLWQQALARPEHDLQHRRPLPPLLWLTKKA